MILAAKMSQCMIGLIFAQYVKYRQHKKVLNNYSLTTKCAVYTTNGYIVVRR